MTDQELTDRLRSGDMDVLLDAADRIAALSRVEAERDAANGYLEKIDRMFGMAYPNEILAVLEEWRGAQGE